MVAVAEQKTTPVDVQPAVLAQWLQRGEAVVIDVREDFEHAAERIAGAENHPLSKFDATALRARYGDRRIVFHCRGGKRSAEACGRFQQDSGPVFHLAGGLQGWKNAGLPTVVPAAAPKIDVMRQTQMTIGALVLAGVLLGAFVSPWFLILSGFMGAGLIFAGASGTCGMATMLGKLPWNRTAPSCPVHPR